jgi:polyhydroxyalkanoate synthase
MVTPLNFHDQGLLSWWAREEHFDVDKIVDTWGNVPAHFFSSSFPWLVPTAPIKKARTLYQKQDDEDFLLRFLALDLWISENIDFPGEVYREIIKLGYQKNVLVKDKKWAFDGGDSELSKITFPVLNMVAAYDHVSPPESCSLVKDLLPNAACETRIHETGHLGFALGKDKFGQNTSRYWDEIIDWLSIVESKEKR